MRVPRVQSSKDTVVAGVTPVFCSDISGWGNIPAMRVVPT